MFFRYAGMCLSFVFAAACLSAQTSDTITLERIRADMEFLAADERKGRGNGTPELLEAARYIAASFELDSLKLFPGGQSYFIPFLAKPGPNVVLPWQPDESRPEDTLLNVVGVLEGRSLAHEVVIFSAHYDHVGTSKTGRDSVYNGANDNASGTSALLSLAHYYSKRKDNERTLVFCAFAGEEWGLLGSEQFVKMVTPKAVVTVINIEMIGIAGIGKKSFFLTGGDHSNLDDIMKRNLKGKDMKLRHEPYSESLLFQRSDNYPFALKGIPAHTVMSSTDHERCYHQPCDELKSIDFVHMTEMVRTIAVAVQSIIDGKDTPKRIWR